MGMVHDLALADQGQRKIDFASRRMPVLRTLTEQFAETKPFTGHRIAACLHVTTETANMVRALVAGGAEVALCGSNPLSTKDDVAASIQRDLGAEVFAVYGADRDTFYEHVQAVLKTRPTIVVDDGADLTTTIHNDHAELLTDVIGGTEVTSTGVLRIKNMADDGALRYPVFPTNDAATKHLFDNRYGTGQNTIDGILRATNMLLAGSTFVVVGYGWCGRGVAMRARGMGANVIVVEVDPVRALEAVLDGLTVMPMSRAAEHGDIFVTVTGNRDVITIEHMRKMKDGAVVANSGHFDIEIGVEDLRKEAEEVTELRPNCVEYRLPAGNRVLLLAEGRLVGQSAAEAHPAEVMDMTFATQALALEYLVANAESLPAGVHGIPKDIENRVAKAKLDAYGIEIEQLSDQQKRYLTDWRVGT
ncbi:MULTISPECIES: adenosylhomocysteinase [Saccharopolyspora]|uniref:Adenosylhomocysteinase n=1 Tax=Saccharopolyspora elongata TaxID=2530387 RepID=A0A4R4Y3G7_9PSEU|nr:adenosylhomocysteinase [Saccharopolyspora elongata]TDD38064.1 adenosylhomocysteinase [Saccharopolyspora elongata]